MATFLFLPKAFGQISRNFTNKDRPTYELGAGVISLNLPDYPGASSTTTRTIPFPWLIYRGEYLKADEEGSRLHLFRNDNFELGVSGGFNFPIDSNANSAREGMPDTDLLVGVGPALLYRYPFESKLQRLTFGLGARISFSTSGSHTQEQGHVLEPSARYWLKLGEDSPFVFFSSFSFSFADEKFNDFFYQVDKEFETQTRDSYNAKAGFSDITTSLGFSYEASKRISIFLGGYYANLSLSANKDSPLVEEEHNLGYIFGIAALLCEQGRGC
ncbi:MAG: MipA/OmpV family protein [Bacteriovoracaceae bacterium]|nr:MipA/OmpV family protein [Bacteriovoracaceae bacterium]